jgi:hypothetical protein
MIKETIHQQPPHAGAIYDQTKLLMAFVPCGHTITCYPENARLIPQNLPGVSCRQVFLSLKLLPDE